MAAFVLSKNQIISKADLTVDVVLHSRQTKLQNNSRNSKTKQKDATSFDKPQNIVKE